MKTYQIILALCFGFILAHNVSPAQHQSIPFKSLATVIDECVFNSTNFWTELNDSIAYPERAYSAWASEKVSMIILHSDESESGIDIMSTAQNRYFGVACDKIGALFKEHIRLDCPSFYCEFDIVFDREPFSLAKYYGGNEDRVFLYKKETLVIRGFTEDYE